jgi:hypothetical protein
MVDRDLSQRAGRVSGIYQTIATVVIILGVLGIAAGFVAAISRYDDVLVGIMAGLFFSVLMLVYVVVAWAGVQMFAIVAGYIHVRTGSHDK